MLTRRHNWREQASVNDRDNEHCASIDFLHLQEK